MYGMGNRGIIITGIVAVCVVVPSAIYLVDNQPAVIFGIIGAVAVIWWMAKHDWWQRAFALTLVLTIGATSTIAPLEAVAEYGRFAAVLLLLLTTWAGTQGAEPKQYSTLPRRLVGILTVILVLAVASITWSRVPFESLWHAGALGALILIVRSLVRHRWADRATMVNDFRTGYGIVVGSFVACLAAAVAGYGEAYNITGGERLQGIYANPNTVGQLAAITIPLGWGLAREKKSVALALSIVPAVMVLLMSGSRTAIVGVGIAVAWMAIRSPLKTKLTVAYVGALAVLAAVATGWNPLGSSLERFGTTAGGDQFSGRLGIWNATVDLIEAHPLGYGWQSAQAVLAQMYESGVLIDDFTSVHNSYLQFVFDLGFLGLVPLMVLVGYLTVIAARGTTGGIGVGLVGVITAGLVVQLGESSIFGTGQAYPYVFWFAVAGALTIYEPKEPRARKPADDRLSVEYQHLVKRQRRQATP